MTIVLSHRVKKKSPSSSFQTQFNIQITPRRNVRGQSIPELLLQALQCPEFLSASVLLATSVILWRKCITALEAQFSHLGIMTRGCLRLSPNRVNEERRDYLSVNVELLSCQKSLPGAQFQVCINNIQGEKSENGTR